jgi:hypothetical protein
MTGYYDYVLGLIPLTLLGITGLLTALGWGITAAVPVGATSATLLIGHAMFVRAPVAAPTPDRAVTEHADGTANAGPVFAD